MWTLLKPRRPAAFLDLPLLGVGGLLLAACGDDDDIAAPDNGEASVSLETRDFEYEPSELSISAGEATVIELTNNGDNEHNITIEELGIDQDVDPGDSASTTVTADAGTYDFFCEYHPDQMQGTLEAD